MGRSAAQHKVRFPIHVTNFIGRFISLFVPSSRRHRRDVARSFCSKLELSRSHTKCGHLLPVPRLRIECTQTRIVIKTRQEKLLLPLRNFDFLISLFAVLAERDAARQERYFARIME